MSYIIGGFCLGGIVAYELAQQLAASGKRVEMLLLIDAKPEDKTLRMVRQFCELLGHWFGCDEERQLNYFRRWWLRREQFVLWRKSDEQAQAELFFRQINRILGSAWKRFRPKPESVKGSPAGTPSTAHHRDILATFLWAAAGYRAEKYWSPMMALLSEDLLERSDHLEDKWKQLAPKAVVRPLKGSHLECITTHVDNLAQAIDEILTPETITTVGSVIPSNIPVLVN